MQSRYKRVSTQEEHSDQDDKIKKQKLERSEKLTAKLHAVLWIIIATVVIIYTKIFEKAFSDDSNVSR